MKSKGQALVEFIIILPILLLLLLGVTDIGKVIYFGNTLEYRLDDAISMYRDDLTEDDIVKSIKESDDSIELEIDEGSEYVTFTMSKSVAIVMPGLNLVFGDPYELSVKRVISNEK